MKKKMKRIRGKKVWTECSHLQTHTQTWGVQSVPCQYFQLSRRIRTFTLKLSLIYTHTPWTAKSFSHKTTEITTWLGKDHCMRLLHCTLHKIERDHTRQKYSGDRNTARYISSGIIIYSNKWTSHGSRNILIYSRINTLLLLLFL